MREKELAQELYRLVMSEYELKITEKTLPYYDENGNKIGTLVEYTENLFDAFGELVEVRNNGIKSKAFKAFLTELEMLIEKEHHRLEIEYGLCEACGTRHVFDNGDIDCDCGKLSGNPDRPIEIRLG